MRIRYKVTGFEEMMDSIRDVQRAPERARPLLEQVLRRQFVDAQSKVHTHPPGGSFLKASGRMSSEYDSVGKRWEGTLEWGGEIDDPGAGPRTLGAVWGELDRGGEHSRWADELYLFDEQYRDALREAFRSRD